jgi:hypothetical protein
MPKILEAFILDTPYLFLKKIPYAWIFAVFFWSWPPILSGILLGLVALGLGMMALQEQAWRAMARRDFHPAPGPPTLICPRLAWKYRLRNILIMLTASALLGWVLSLRLGWTWLQWFLALSGFLILYQDNLILGRPLTLMLTASGVAIRYIPGHMDYRIFIRFDEIRAALPMSKPEPIPVSWSVLAPTGGAAEGLLLKPLNPKGFNQSLEEIFIAPGNVPAFLPLLPAHLRRAV